MITQLKIMNLFLFDEITVNFIKGLHIFTGETGAGKTAILSSLQLILGSKADQNGRSASPFLLC